MTYPFSYVKLLRSKATEGLLRHPNSFTLLALIAQRACREVPAVNPYALQAGESLIGDYDAAGLTRQQFRTALAHLQKLGLIISRPTNKGTIASLSDTSIYDINLPPAQPTTLPNQQNNQQLNQQNGEEATSKISRLSRSNTVGYGENPPNSNQQNGEEATSNLTINSTTNKKDKKKEEENINDAAPAAELVPSSLAEKKASKAKNDKAEGGPTFDQFWQAYDKKVDKHKCAQRWKTLSPADRQTALAVLPAYVAATPERKYRKNPLTWLNGRCWLDEEVPPTKVESAPVAGSAATGYNVPSLFAKKASEQPPGWTPESQFYPKPPESELNQEFIAEQEAKAAAARSARLDAYAAAPTPPEPSDTSEEPADEDTDTPEPSDLP